MTRSEKELLKRFALRSVEQSNWLIKVVSCLIWKVFCLLYRPQVHGLNNLVQNENYVLVANHSSLWDPIVLFAVNPKLTNWVAKKELFNSKILSYFLRQYRAIPLERNKVDLEAIKQMINVLKQGNGVLGIFPQGTRVNDQTVTETLPKTGVVSILLRQKATIVPAYVPHKLQLGKRNHYYIGDSFCLFSAQKKPSELESLKLAVTMQQRSYQLAEIAYELKAGELNAN